MSQDAAQQDAAGHRLPAPAVPPGHVQRVSDDAQRTALEARLRHQKEQALRRAWLAGLTAAALLVATFASPGGTWFLAAATVVAVAFGAWQMLRWRTALIAWVGMRAT